MDVGVVFGSGLGHLSKGVGAGVLLFDATAKAVRCGVGQVDHDLAIAACTVRTVDDAHAVGIFKAVAEVRSALGLKVEVIGACGTLLHS